MRYPFWVHSPKNILRFIPVVLCPISRYIQPRYIERLQYIVHHRDDRSDLEIAKVITSQGPTHAIHHSCWTKCAGNLPFYNQYMALYMPHTNIFGCNVFGQQGKTTHRLMWYPGQKNWEDNQIPMLCNHRNEFHTIFRPFLMVTITDHICIFHAHDPLEYFDEYIFQMGESFAFVIRISSWNLHVNICGNYWINSLHSY